MQTRLYDHFLLTRFNLRRAEWEHSKSGAPVLTDQWLKNRFEIFEKYCFYSVKNQVNQNFRWLVFFDSTTPLPYRTRIAQYKDSFSAFLPVYVDGMPQFLPTIQKKIKESDANYLITSRLDNDDCLSKHYVDRVQSNFEKREYMAIDFVDGYTLQIEPQIRAGKRKQLYNPFISLIEKNDSPQSVWCREIHSSWKREKNVKRITGQQIWMSVIHAENKKNEFAGYGRVNVRDLFEEYRIDDRVARQIEEKSLDVSRWRIASLINRLFSYWRAAYKNTKKALGLYQ